MSRVWGCQETDLADVAVLDKNNRRGEPNLLGRLEAHRRGCECVYYSGHVLAWQMYWWCLSGLIFCADRMATRLFCWAFSARRFDSALCWLVLR